MNYYQIETKLGYHHPLIKICIARYEDTKSAEDRTRCGRSKISTARNDLVLLRTVRKNRRWSSTKLAQAWKLSNGIKASSRTKADYNFIDTIGNYKPKKL